MGAAMREAVLAAVEIALILGSGLAYGQSALRKAASLTLAVITPALPWLLPADALFLRGLYAVFSLLPLFKWIQCTVDGDVGSAGHRTWQWIAIFDVRETTRVRPHFDAKLLLHLGVYAATAAGGTAVLVAAGPLSPSSWPLHLVGGVAAVIGLVQSVIDLVRLVHAAFGVHVPPIQREPLLSTSVRDFWGRRWNRTVSDWLRRYVFAPLARRGHPVLGIVAAFAASAAFHFYIVIVPLGIAEGLVMAAFFLAQVPLIFIERRALTGAGRLERRLFAIFGLAATSPLFTIPFVEIWLG